MEHDKENWGRWLNSVPAPQQRALYEVLKTKVNGKTPASEETSSNAIITRTPTEDLMIDNPPVYVDVFDLHEIYRRLAFTTNLLLKGPKGDGKTLSFFSYAATIGCPVVVQECSDETRDRHLMGTQSLLGNKTLWTLGSVPTAIEVANEMGHCILLFEEISALTPQIQKMLNAITDFRMTVSLPSIGKRYRLREGALLWVGATMNLSTYGGTYDMNEDLKSRFEEIELTYPAFLQEKQIVKAVCTGLNLSDDLIDNVINFARESRQQATGYSLSTRDVNRLLSTISKVGLENALQMVIGKFEDSDKDVMLKRMGSHFKGLKPLKKFWGSI